MSITGQYLGNARDLCLLVQILLPGSWKCTKIVSTPRAEGVINERARRIESLGIRPPSMHRIVSGAGLEIHGTLEPVCKAGAQLSVRAT